MERLKSTEYLYASSRTKALETFLLNEERLLRMAEATSDDEAVKVLEECGYGEDISSDNIDTLINERRRIILDDVEKMLPEPTLINLFRFKYDYHNIKTVLKSKGADEEMEKILIDIGTVSADKVRNGIKEGDYIDFDSGMRASIAEALEVLNRTHDPQLSDTVLDRSLYTQMLEIAKSSANAFLIDYVQLLINTINLRTMVRLNRMGQSFTRLEDFYIEGGTVPKKDMMTELTPEKMEELYSNDSVLSEVASVGAEIMKGNMGLSKMDLAADDGIVEFLKQAKNIGFGVEPVIAYTAAIDMEGPIIQTMMAYRKLDKEPGEIMENMRKTYA